MGMNPSEFGMNPSDFGMNPRAEAHVVRISNESQGRGPHQHQFRAKPTLASVWGEARIRISICLTGYDSLGAMPTSLLESFLHIFDFNTWTYLIFYVVLIIFFTYFYTAITFNIQELADNMKKYGGFIPGIRAGQKTVEFLERTTSRVTLAGGIFLSIVAVIPNLLIKYMGVNFYFGGTALLIVVGVAMDTMRQLESHLVTRNYEGFMKKNKGLR